MNMLLASALVASAITTMNPAVAAPPQRIFYSGHSLLDEPLPRDVAAIAASLGTPLQHWERDTPPGSSATWCERVAQGGVAGVNVAALFRDDVHLTALGSYFMSLVVYTTLFERSPTGGAVPEDVDVNSARTPQSFAWELVQQERAQRQTLRPADCREHAQAFVATHAAHLRDVIDRPRLGLWRAWWLWAKHRAQWYWALRR
jgi:hypothetical protein